MKSDSLFTLLLRLLSLCNLGNMSFRHAISQDVTAEKLSHHNQVIKADGPSTSKSSQDVIAEMIKAEWSLHQENFNLICKRWHTPQIDLFATRYNKILPLFVSPLLEKEVWPMGAKSLSWEGLDSYAFPPTPLITNVINKIFSINCQRIIVVAPGWPNMWFRDLVNLSSQIPLCQPNQATPAIHQEPTQRSTLI